MPWSVNQKGSKYVVKKKGSGKVVGEHETREEAEAQMKALYAQEDKEREG